MHVGCVCRERGERREGGGGRGEGGGGRGEGGGGRGEGGGGTYKGEDVMSTCASGEDGNSRTWTTKILENFHFQTHSLRTGHDSIRHALVKSLIIRNAS